jgi:WD40 repeat protein
MAWPASQDYNEAIQDPSSSFQDPELRAGLAVNNSFGIPQPCSGNFADVYEVRCPGGSRWAVKCFTREVRGLSERYEVICRCLGQAALPFAVDSTFLKEGIRIHGRWYPILKMQWVEGLTLQTFVRQHADKPIMLDALLQIWARMAVRLREAGVAHGDLQHGNVLLVPGRNERHLAVKLVDYDGMFVPALTQQPSGEVGHPAYQHPQRARDQGYNAEIDRFPLLLVATALASLKAGGRALWEKYDNGDNLLFREADLQAPVKSRLFYELLKLPDPLTQELVRHLLDALRGNLEATRLLEEVLPEQSASPRAAPAASSQGSRGVKSSPQRARTSAGSARSNSPGPSAVQGEPRRTRKSRRPLWITAGVVAAGLAAALAVWVLFPPSPSPVRTSADRIAQITPATELLAAPPTASPSNAPDHGPPPPSQSGPAATAKGPPSSSACPPETSKKPTADAPPATVKEPAAPPVKPPDQPVIPAEEPFQLREVFTLKAPEFNKLWSFSVSRDGKLALFSGEERDLDLWDCTTGTRVPGLRPVDEQRYLTAALSPDGRRAIISSTTRRGPSLYLAEINPAASLRNFAGHEGLVRKVCFVPDGKRAVSWGEDQSLRIWDVETGAEVRAMRGPEQPVSWLETSADGTLALTCSQDGTACLWDLIDGGCVERLEGVPAGNRITAATLSLDGATALLGHADGQVHLWDLQNRRSIVTLNGHSKAVHTVALSPNGQYAVTGSGAGEKAAAFLWLLAGDRSRHISLPRAALSPMAAVFSPDGRRILGGSPEGTARIWEITGGPPRVAVKPVEPLDPSGPAAKKALERFSADKRLTLRNLFFVKRADIKQVKEVGLSADGKLALAVYDGVRLDLWDLAERKWFDGTQPPGVGPMWTTAALAPDGQRALIGTADGPLQLGNLRVKTDVKGLLGHTGAVRRICFVPDGKRAVTWAEDKTIRTWDLRACTELGSMREPEPGVLSLQVSADGARALTCSADGTASLWDLSKRTRPERFLPEHGSKMTAAALTREGARVLFGYGDGRVIFWDIGKRRSIAAMAAHSGAVHTVVLSPNGQYAVTVGGDDKTPTALLWLLQGGPPQSVPLPTPMVSPLAVVFAADSRHILTGSRDGAIDLLQIRGGPPVLPLPPLEPAKDPPVVVKPPLNPADPLPSKPPIKPADPADSKKLSPPEEQAVASAIKGIREGFKEDYDNARTAPARKAFATSLLEQARLTNDDPVRKFALYREAGDLAATAELPLGLQIAEEMCRTYRLNERAARVAVFVRAGKSVDTPASAKAYLEAALPLLRDAVSEDDYSTVVPMVTSARQAAAIVRDPELQRTANSLLGRVELLHKEYEAIRASVRVLEKTADDPEANQTVGAFLCFFKQEWEKGLPLLAKAGDAALAAAAQQELAKPADRGDQVALGDTWAELARKHPNHRGGMERRAYRWHTLALADLEGRDRERVEKRILEFTELHPDVRAAWDHLDLTASRALTVGDVYLRLPAGRSLATRKALPGAVEMTLVCRSVKKVPKFEVLQGTDTLFIWESTEDTLHVHRPPNPARGLPGLLDASQPAKLSRNTWYTFTCRLTASETEFALKGVVSTRYQGTLELLQRRFIQVRAIGEPLEIRSLRVKRLDAD